MPKDTQLVRNLNPDSLTLKVIFFTTISPEESDTCENSPGRTIEEFEGGRVVSSRAEGGEITAGE